MSRRSTKNKSPMKKIIPSLVAVAIVASGRFDSSIRHFLAPTDQVNAKLRLAQRHKKLLRHRQRKRISYGNKLKGLLGTKL